MLILLKQDSVEQLFSGMFVNVAFFPCKMSQLPRFTCKFYFLSSKYMKNVFSMTKKPKWSIESFLFCPKTMDFLDYI